MTLRPLQTLVLIGILLGTACFQQPDPPVEFQTYVAKIRQVDDVFRFFGIWSKRPETIDRSVFVGEFEFFTSETGMLRMQRKGDRKVKEFNPFHVASSQGHMPPTIEGLDNAARGFEGGGGRIWFGTTGVGILAYDPARDLWERHDVKQESVPGWQSTVLHADDRYVFARTEPFEDHPGSGLCVFNIENEAWFELKEKGEAASKLENAHEISLVDGTTYVVRTRDAAGEESSIEIPAEVLAGSL